MAERSSTKIAAASVPTLSPQGPQAGKPAMPLGRPFTLIGARNRAHLHLLSSTVSRNHACIISTDNGLYIRDLGSRTGVILNGRRVKESDLRDGDTLQIGSFQFKFTDPAGPVRFPLTPKAASAMLEMAGTQTPLDTRTLLIGRRTTSDITLTEQSVSNTHVLIFEVNGQRFIRDLGSRTGTIVNGKPVNHQLLDLGDEIKIGDTTFHYVSASIAEAPAKMEEPELELEEEPIGIDFSQVENEAAAPLIPLEKEEAATIPLDRIPLEESEPEPLTLPPTPLKPASEEEGPPLEEATAARVETPSEEEELPLEEAPAPSVETRLPIREPPSAPLELLEPVEDLGLEFEAPAPPQAIEPPVEPIPVPVSDAPELTETVESLTPPEADEIQPLPAEPEASPLQLDISPIEVEPEAPVAPMPMDATSDQEAPTVESEPIFTAPQPIETEGATDTTMAAAADEQAPLAGESLPEAIALTDEQALAEEPAEVSADLTPPISEPEPQQYLTAAEPVELEPVVDHTIEEITAPPEPVEVTAGPIEVEPETQVPLPVAELPAEPVAEQVEFISSPAEPALPEMPVAEQPADKRKRGRGGRGSRKKAVEEAPGMAAADLPAPPPGRRRSSRKKSPTQEPQARIDVAPTQDISIEASPVEPEPQPINLSVATEELPAPSVMATEVLESTEPTPESALDIEPALEQVAAQDEQVLTGNIADTGLTDTAFGQVVQEFAGSGLGPLVEEPPPAAKEAAAEALEATPSSVSETEASPAVESERSELSNETQQSPAQEESDSFDFDLPDLDLSIDLAETPAEHAVGIEEFHREEPVVAPDIPSEPPPAPAAEHAVPELESAPHEMAIPLDDSMSSTESIAPSRQRLMEPSQIEPRTADAAEASAPLADEVEPQPQVTVAQATESHPPESEPQAQAPQPPSVPESPAKPNPPVEESVSVPPPRPPIDPFFGMSRDLASFIGGMPLTLTSTAPLAPAPPTVAPPLPPPPPAQARAVGEETLVFSDRDAEPFPPLDLSLPDESPLDLFEKVGEKVDQIPDEVRAVKDVAETVQPATSVPASPRLAPPPQPPAAPIDSPAPPPRPALSQVAPPPPPRTSPLRSFTTSPQPAAPPSNLSMTPPPFGGVPQQQRITMPAVRQVDVFSNIAFPPLDPSMFGAPQRPQFPPGSRQTPAPPPQHQPAEQVETQLQTARPRREAVLPNRQIPAVPSNVAVEAPPQPRRPWWRSLRFLLPLMILAILVVIVVVMFFPPHHIVQGSLQLQGVGENQNIAAHQQLVRLRKLVGTAHVRQLALENLRQQNLDPGFVADFEALESLSDPRNSPFDESRNRLVLTRASRDIEGDTLRMKALLAALYAESGSVNDQSARDRQELDRKQPELQQLQAQQTARQTSIQKLSEQIASSGGSAAQAVLVNPLISLQQAEQTDSQLQQALADAAQTVEKRRQDLRQVQQKALASDPQTSGQYNGMVQTVADWWGKLDALLTAQQMRAEQAASNFDKSLDDFDRQLASFPSGSSDQTLKTYLLLAGGEISNIRQINAQLLARRKHDQLILDQLRRQITDRREAHLRQVWSDDASLQQLLEERSATSSSEALQTLDTKIDARRSALATIGQDADQVQQKLHLGIARLQADIQADEQQLSDKLKWLSPPSFDALSGASQQAAAELSKLAAQLAASHDAYAAAALLGAEAANETEGLLSQIAQQQARLDTFRTPHPDPQVQRAVLDLDAAQTTQANAALAYNANHAMLAPLRQLATLITSEDLQERVRQKQQEVDDLQAAVAASPLVLKPDGTAITVALTPDRRFQYLIAGIIAVLLLFAGPLWMSFGKSHEDIPFAAPLIEGYDVPGSPLYLPEPEHFEDEHPATA